MSQKIEKQGARVSVLDAQHLDEELHNILKFQVQAALKYFPPWIVGRWDLEINAILKLIIWKMSVLKSHSTFGQQMLNLKYSEETFSLNKAYLLAFLNVCSDYLKQNPALMSNQSSSVISFLFWSEITLDLLKLSNLILFLRNGYYPTLFERILKMRPISVSKGPRIIGYNYMTRELMWHGFIELLGFILPLINYQYLRKKFLRIFSKPNDGNPVQSFVFTVSSKCAFCNEPPIFPQSINCPHVFCYYCLESNRLVDMKYECPVCYFTQENATQVTFK